MKLELQLSIDTTSVCTVALFSLLSAVGLARCLSLCSLALTGPRERKHRCTQERNENRRARKQNSTREPRTKQEDTTGNTARIHSPRPRYSWYSRVSISSLSVQCERREREGEKDGRSRLPPKSRLASLARRNDATSRKREGTIRVTLPFSLSFYGSRTSRRDGQKLKRKSFVSDAENPTAKRALRWTPRYWAARSEAPACSPPSLPIPSTPTPHSADASLLHARSADSARSCIFAAHRHLFSSPSDFSLSSPQMMFSLRLSFSLSLVPLEKS